jgi:hypothetical protein
MPAEKKTKDEHGDGVDNTVQHPEPKQSEKNKDSVSLDA